MLSTLFAFALALCPLVFFHELGHYWVARLCGVKIESFSIGFGPAFWSWTDRHGTQWRLSVLPLGGYVKMLGDADASSALPGETVDPVDADKTFHSKKPWQRILIASAGPVANYILAAVLFITALCVFGQPLMDPIVGPVGPDSAISQHVKPGDKIVRIQNQEVHHFGDILDVLGHMPASSPLDMQVERSGQLLNLTIPVVNQAQGVWRGKLGLVPAGDMKWSALSYGQAVRDSFSLIKTTTVEPFRALFSGNLGGLGGPLGIAKQAGESFEQGLAAFIFFMANLSVGLAAFNFLPIPLLDGGSILMSTVEWIRGKPLGRRFQEILSWASIVLLGGLFLILSGKDLYRFPIVQKLVHYII